MTAESCIVVNDDPQIEECPTCKRDALCTFTLTEIDAEGVNDMGRTVTRCAGCEGYVE